MALRNLQILYLSYARENATTFGRNVVHFPVRNTIYLIVAQGYIFRILQHFAAKRCNFTNSNMLFLAVVMDFVLLAYIKI
jgi:hypothetical protein